MDQSFGDFYEILVKEPIDSSWSDWFDNFEISRTGTGNTRIIGCLKDKTALYGLLDWMRDLNLTLLYLRRFE